MITAEIDRLKKLVSQKDGELSAARRERDELAEQLVTMRATLSSVADWMQRFTVGLARITEDEPATMRRIGEAEALPISPAEAAAAERLKGGAK